MISKKVTSIILICVFVVRPSSVVKMPVLSLHALPFDFRIVLKALFFMFIDNFWQSAVRQFHTTQVGTHTSTPLVFIRMWKVLETSVPKLDSCTDRLIKFVSCLVCLNSVPESYSGYVKRLEQDSALFENFHRTFPLLTTTYHQFHAVSTLFQPFLPIESTSHFELHSFLIPQNLVFISKCLLFTNICTNKYCKFIFNYSDMFRC